MEPSPEGAGRGSDFVGPAAVSLDDIVLLDSGPLGVVTHPRGSEETKRCQRWCNELLKSGVCVRIPDICDYEVRRELLRAQKGNGIDRINMLRGLLDPVPLDWPALQLAAELWAQARREGQPTAGNRELDGDMILVAQARLVAEASGREVIIATTNVGHLSRFTAARHWSDLLPPHT